MKYLLILFVIALALAPLRHVLPSRRQREIARLREYAAVHGLFVEFRALPGAASGAGPERSPGDVIYYGKRLRPPRGREAQRGSWVRDSEGWRGLQRSGPAPEPLLQLPRDILGASVDEGSCGIYWQESGEEEMVEQIRGAVEGWAAAMGR